MRKRERQALEGRAVELVRGRVLSGLHGGRLHAGDRLPSYRDVAAETGLDLRAVTRVYEALAVEGLVEVRGRAGVFVADQERLGGQVMEETARWMIGVLREFWARQKELPSFPDFARERIASTTVSCVCIESTTDQIDAICHELSRDFGFRTHPLHTDHLADFPADRAPGESLPAEVREADVLVTTAFHAALVRPVAELLRKPLMVIRLNPDIVRELHRLAASGELTVICVDPRFAERVRLVVGGENAGAIRTVLADDSERIRRLDPSRPVVISHAASVRIGETTMRSAIQEGRVLSAESAEELTELLIRFNVRAMSGEQDAA